VAYISRQLSGLKHPRSHRRALIASAKLPWSALNTDARAIVHIAKNARARSRRYQPLPSERGARGRERMINLKKKERVRTLPVVKMHRFPAPPIPGCRPGRATISFLPHRRASPHAAAGILHASRKLSCVVTFALTARESFALLRTMEIVRGEWCTDSWHGACGLRIMAGLTSNFCRHLFHRV